MAGRPPEARPGAGSRPDGAIPAAGEGPAASGPPATLEPRSPSPRRFWLLGGEAPTAGLSRERRWRHRVRPRQERPPQSGTDSDKHPPSAPCAGRGAGRGSALNRASRCPRRGPPAAALQTETRGRSHKPASTGRGRHGLTSREVTGSGLFLRARAQGVFRAGCPQGEGLRVFQKHTRRAGTGEEGAAWTASVPPSGAWVQPQWDGF